MTVLITVTTKPTSPTQTCAVVNGSGTVETANVTNVSINCATNTYTIGGNVVGLQSGRVLQLSLNGGSPLSISSNGFFAFRQAIPSGQSYSVSVFAQPAGQTCTVTNGNGTVTSANVTNVLISCH